MKRTSPTNEAGSAVASALQESPTPGNGAGVNPAVPSAADLSAILASLQQMQQGDFSARLPGSWTGLPGKIAYTFNDIVAANEQMARELKRVGQAVGKEGKTRERIKVPRYSGSWNEMETSVNTLVED